MSTLKYWLRIYPDTVTIYSTAQTQLCTHVYSTCVSLKVYTSVLQWKPMSFFKLLMSNILVKKKTLKMLGPSRVLFSCVESLKYVIDPFLMLTFCLHGAYHLYVQLLRICTQVASS